ncbi:hypothetical protein Tco_0020396 [Tanacetum coccineum]
MHYKQLEGWLAVRRVKIIDAFNMRCDNDDNSHVSSSCIINIPNLDRVGVDVGEVVDGTLIIESEEEVDEDEENHQSPEAIANRLLEGDKDIRPNKVQLDGEAALLSNPPPGGSTEKKQTNEAQ